MIFTDNYINEIIDKSKTRHSIIVSTITLLERIGDTNRAEELLTRATTINAYIDTLSNSNILLTDKERYDVAQKLQEIAEIEKIQSVFNYDNNVTEAGSGQYVELSSFNSLETKVDIHIADSNNPHDISLSDIVDSTSKGRLYVGNGSEVVSLNGPTTTNQLLKKSTVSVTGLEWGKFSIADMYDIPQFSILGNPLIYQDPTAQNPPLPITIGTNSVFGRIGSGALGSISLANAYNNYSGANSKVPTWQAVLDEIDFKAWPSGGLSKASGGFKVGGGNGLKLGGIVYEDTAISSFDGSHSFSLTNFRETLIETVSSSTRALKIVSKNGGGIYLDAEGSDSLSGIIEFVAKRGGQINSRLRLTANAVQVDNGYFNVPIMTAAQASAGNEAIDGSMVFVTDTNATFTGVGLWITSGGTWVKLAEAP